MHLLDLLTEAKIAGRLLCIGFSHNRRESAISKEFKSPTFVAWDELIITDGDLQANESSVSSFSKVLIGAVGDNVALMSCLESYLKTHKVKWLAYGSPTEKNNKPLQTILLAERKVSQIKTVIGAGKALSADALASQLNLPIVSKIIDGSQGKGVKKHDTKESLASFLKQNQSKPHIFQEFIPNDGDYRAFFVKSKLIYAIRRTSQERSEFRNNVSLGGKQEFSELPAEALQLAKQAVSALAFDVTGVDLIQHRETKKWYVIEVNSAPQFEGPEFDEVMNALISVVKAL